MFKYKSYLFILFFVCYSCSTTTGTLSFFKSNKKIHYPGISTGKSFIQYDIEFDSSENFEVNEVLLNTSKIGDYLLYSYQSRKYVAVNETYIKGKYILIFKLNDVKSIDNEDYVFLFIKKNLKVKKHKLKIKKVKPFRSR